MSNPTPQELASDKEFSARIYSYDPSKGSGGNPPPRPSPHLAMLNMDPNCGACEMAWPKASIGGSSRCSGIFGTRS